jgi:TolA-binding protein
MKKQQLGLVLLFALIIGCSGSKNLQQELETVKQESQGTDSVLFMLDLRLKEFSKEVKAMRETYNENHISLENLYKLNADSRRAIDDLSKNVDSQLAAEKDRADSLNQTVTQASEERIAGLQAEQFSIRESMTELGSSLRTAQFQVDSIFASMDPEKISIMEENMMSILDQVSLLDSSFTDFQLVVTDHMMISQDQISNLERHAQVQDSANYDILSQLVLLENKIISLTNSFNELMAMPGTTPNVVISQPQYSTQTPVSNRPVDPVPQVQKMDYETYKQHYIDALSLYQNGDFMAAIDQFKALLSNDSDNDYADNAQYWIGESYYALEDHARAIDAFRKVLNYKDSNKADAAQFKIGYSYLNSGDKARGYNELERLLDMFPESSYRDKVKQILASR